jgi:hypothetical protein
VSGTADGPAAESVGTGGMRPAAFGGPGMTPPAPTPSGGAAGAAVAVAAQTSAEQVRYAVEVALGWAEDAGRAFGAHLADMPVLPAERDMLAAKLGAVVADLRLVRERMARVAARAGRRARLGGAGETNDHHVVRAVGEPARCPA